MKRILISILFVVVFLLACGRLLFYNAILRFDDVEEPAYNIDSNPSITIPFNRLVLVKSGNHFGAFKILRRASHLGFLNGAKYEYWYQQDGTRDLTKKNVLHGTEIVYEKYKKEKNDSGGYNLTDIGSQLNIKVGPLWVEWSDGNHIYANSYWTEKEQSEIKTIEITATPWEDVSNIDLSSLTLKWIGEMSHNAEAFQQGAAANADKRRR